MTTEEKQQGLDIKDQLLITEWILRIATIQNLLIEKGVFSVEEFNQSLEKTVETYGKILTGATEEN